MEWLSIVSDMGLTGALIVGVHFLWRAWRLDVKESREHAEQMNEAMTTLLRDLVQESHTVIINNTQALTRICTDLPDMLQVRERQDLILAEIRRFNEGAGQ